MYKIDTSPSGGGSPAQAPSQPSSLIDRFGRRVDYVRLSVTDRCDLRCVYCMTEDMTFLPRREILSLEELYRVARCFVELGVRKLRLTGGEPMVRSNVMELITRIGAMKNKGRKNNRLEELLLTTNGAQLEKYAQPLQQAGVDRLNISLDSLDASRFRRISRVGDLQRVLVGIEAARAAGFRRIRLNSVIMRGYNDDEIIPLAEFAISRGLDIAFIEEMPLGEASDHRREDTVYSNAEVRRVLEGRYDLIDSTARSAGPSRYCAIAGQRSRVGFISPMSHNFCADCNRVRVTVEGRLLLCLGNEHSVDLRAVLRKKMRKEVRKETQNESATDTDLKQAIIGSMAIKPQRHYFYEKDHPQPVRLMNMTGG